MSTITISNLNPVGVELLSDEETFLNELNDTEQDFVKGGITPSLAFSMSLAASFNVVKVGAIIVKEIMD